MFAISYYTALTLYRSAFMGKKSEMGATTLKNLGNILSCINKQEWARSVEHIMDLPIFKELCDLTKKPFESIEVLPAETVPALTGPPSATDAQRGAGDAPSLREQCQEPSIAGFPPIAAATATSFEEQSVAASPVP